MASCPNCNGTGEFQVDSGVFIEGLLCLLYEGSGPAELHQTSPSWMQCPDCGGTGEDPLSHPINPIRCSTCNGRGWGTRSSLGA